MSTKAKKVPMEKFEFYDVSTRSRVKVDPDTVIIKTIAGSKYKDGKPRYQAVGLTGGGKKVYKFVNAAYAEEFE